MSADTTYMTPAISTSTTSTISPVATVTGSGSILDTGILPVTSGTAAVASVSEVQPLTDVFVPLDTIQPGNSQICQCVSLLVVIPFAILAFSSLLFGDRT